MVLRMRILLSILFVAFFANAQKGGYFGEFVDAEVFGEINAIRKGWTREECVRIAQETLDHFAAEIVDDERMSLVTQLKENAQRDVAALMEMCTLYMTSAYPFSEPASESPLLRDAAFPFKQGLRWLMLAADDDQKGEYRGAIYAQLASILQQLIPFYTRDTMKAKAFALTADGLIREASRLGDSGAQSMVDEMNGHLAKEEARDRPTGAGTLKRRAVQHGTLRESGPQQMRKGGKGRRAAS